MALRLVDCLVHFPAPRLDQARRTTGLVRINTTGRVGFPASVGLDTSPQRGLQPGTDCQASSHVSQPMREQHEASAGKPCYDRPDPGTPRLWHPAHQRCRDRAEMDSVPRRETIVWLARVRHAMAWPTHDSPVRPLPFYASLEQVRQSRRDGGGQHQVISPTPAAGIVIQQPNANPGDAHDGDQQLLIRRPGDHLGRALGLRACHVRHSPRQPQIGRGRLECQQSASRHGVATRPLALRSAGVSCDGMVTGGDGVARTGQDGAG